MKLLSKSLLSCVALGSIMGLSACQSTPMNQSHAYPHANMGHDMQARGSLTEGQVLKVLSVANNGEISQANIALPNLEMEEVRSFAENMVEKHTMNEQKGQVLGASLGLMPQVSHTSNALQVDSNNVVTKLSQTDSPADKEYIMSQIVVHTKVLDTIDSQLLPSTKSPALRNFLVETRSAVAMHLKTAQQINSMMP